MGLDTTHDCWHGPYGAFHRWRKALAHMAGIDLDKMDGFGIPGRSGEMLIRWDTLPPDPLHVLLSHSDCDGQIEVADLLPIADRIDAILATLVPTACCPGRFYPGDQHDRHGDCIARADYDGFVKACRRFSSGLRLAASLGEPVEFR